MGLLDALDMGLLDTLDTGLLNAIDMGLFDVIEWGLLDTLDTDALLVGCRSMDCDVNCKTSSSNQLYSRDGNILYCTAALLSLQGDYLNNALSQPLTHKKPLI
jgi:hypothetical protein